MGVLNLMPNGEMDANKSKNQDEFIRVKNEEED